MAPCASSAPAGSGQALKMSAAVTVNAPDGTWRSSSRAHTAEMGVFDLRPVPLDVAQPEGEVVVRDAVGLSPRPVRILGDWGQALDEL